MIRTVEICAADIDSVAAAAEGGAGRVELCSALGEGGLTPSAGLIEKAVADGRVQVNVLIRPRGGDFLYTPREVEIMEADIRLCRTLGAHGVVIGALNADGGIDTSVCRRLIDAAGNLSVTFHRAFDVCRDTDRALEDIIDLGCRRILTSGHAPSALEGAAEIRRLKALAGGRVYLMAGGGVTPANAARIAELSDADELHGSARVAVPSLMRYRVDGVKMGAPDADEYLRHSTGPDVVRAIVNAVKN